MTTTSLATCAACGRPDALGLGLCSECGGHGGAGDALIFVRRTEARRDRQRLTTRLEELLGPRAGTPAGQATARGDHALVRLPEPVTGHVMAALERNGVPVRSVRVDRAFLLMPAHFFLMLAAIALVGSAAGAAGSPALMLTSPLLAAGLLLIARRSMQRPLIRSPVSEALPPAADTAVISAFSRLGSGRARELLADLISMARPLLARLREDGDVGSLEPTLAELITTACVTALEVDRLASSAAVVRDEMTAFRPSNVDANALAAAAERCTEAAATGMSRLVEAVAAVADAGGRTAMLDGSAADRLVQLTRALKDDATRREDALREVGRLLES